MKSITPAKMRHIDNIAINKYGIANITLMENAGARVAEVAKKVLARVENKSVCVVCGKGNNGGDGLVVSRHLINAGFNVDTYVLAKAAALTEEARFNLELLGKTPREITSLRALARFIDRFDYGLAVDAIFGTGFSKTNIREPIKSLISFLNRAANKIISVDIPSGLNGSSGKIGDVAIKSSLTVTLGLPKKGFFCAKGPFYTGRLVVKNIGFPSSLLGHSA